MCLPEKRQRKGMVQLKRKEKRQDNLIEFCGIDGILICLIGMFQGYLSGFLSEHKAVRGIGRAALLITAFAVAFTTVSAYGTLQFPKLSKNAESVPVAKAAEETPDLADTEEKTESPIEKLLATETELVETVTDYAETVTEAEPLDDSILEPSDIYTEKGKQAVFKAYHPKAQAYQWEIYDTEKAIWKKAPQEAIAEQADELRRRVSLLELSADTDQRIRCLIDLGTAEPMTCEADLYILPGQIESLSADAYSVEAKTYASSMDIPVKVTYRDGKKESVTGLSGLYFLEQSESSENAITSAGNSRETITTVRTAHEYTYIGQGSRERQLLYRKDDGESIDIPVNITGLDQTAPQITDFTISDIEVSNVEQAVPVTVTIKAMDEVTPLRKLTYAFKPEGEEPGKADWTDASVLQTEITKNGVWTAYCRDEAGNIATKTREILATDTEAPAVSLTLEKTEWCQENKILVSAEDKLSVEYRYLCEKTGEDSGWIREASRHVGKNGEWKIQVRDAVGNLAEQTIVVDNIDTQAPVIRGITEKPKGETANNEE